MPPTPKARRVPSITARDSPTEYKSPVEVILKFERLNGQSDNLAVLRSKKSVEPIRAVLSRRNEVPGAGIPSSALDTSRLGTPLVSFHLSLYYIRYQFAI